MIEINLVPDVKQELIKAQHARTAVATIAILVGAISIAIVLLLAVYVFMIQGFRSSIYDGEINKYDKEFSSVDDLSKILTIQNQLNTLPSLNESKHITSRIFNVLNAIIPPTPNDIKVSTLTVKTSEDSITIEGYAQNSYAALDVFKKTLLNAKIKYKDSSGNSQEPVNLASNVSIGNDSYGQDATGNKVLRFTLTFNYAEELFALSSKDATVTITGEDNATDSYKGIPIFADEAENLTEDDE
ncbi:MAG: hypothetical protein PHO93_00130 [Candidatus Saccharimonadaceae bacterium]|nr:hypothetical protein [Candidatus Saccharimonadaceae bacterium]